MYQFVNFLVKFIQLTQKIGV